MPLRYNFELNVLLNLVSMNPQVDLQGIQSLEQSLLCYAWYRNDLLYRKEKKKVWISRDLLSNPQYKKYESVILDICLKIERGKDLISYLSRRKKSPLNTDALLESANIHHFHLNTKHIGNELLFAYCDLLSPNEVYLLNIGTHEDFEKISVWYAILFKNWPNLRNKLLGEEFLVLVDSKNSSIKKHLYGTSYGVIPFEDKALLVGMNRKTIKSAIKGWQRMLKILEEWILNYPEDLCRAANIPLPIWEEQWVYVTNIGYNFISFRLGNSKLRLQDRGYIELMIERQSILRILNTT